MIRTGPCLLAALAVTTPALGAPVAIDIDPARSTVNFELCVEGDCDDDTSRVDGTVRIELDDWHAPGRITLHDFEIVLLDDIDLHISKLLGGIDVLGTGIVTRYAYPGTPHPPAPVGPGGAFTWTDVPTNADGRLTYHATGSVCLVLLAAGYPCDDDIDLADRGTQNAEEMSGTVSVDGDRVTLVFQPNLTVPLDPAQPGVGHVTLAGQVVGEGAVPPCPAAPGPVGPLRATRAGAGIDFSWEPEPSSTLGYRVYSVARKERLPASGSNPEAARECETAAVSATGCTDADPWVPPSDRAYYEVVGVCGDGSEGAN